jgi:hypothetical protein
MFSPMWQKPRFRHLVRVSLGRDRFFQNVVRGSEESCEGFVAQARNFGRRMNARAKKNFVRVNVANTRDEPLVHQDRFHGATTFRQYFSEFCEIDIQRIRAQGALFQKFIDISKQADLAKLTLIVERQTMVVGENKLHSYMPRRLFVVFEILKRSGHAEVQSQPEVAIRAHEQMFAMPPTRFE